MDQAIESHPLPLFLRRAHLENLSGHLLVTAKDFQISLHLREGKLAGAISTRFDEKISVILHLMGHITEEQYNFLSGLHQFSDEQICNILLENRFACKDDIQDARVYQLRRIAISTFSLDQGKWEFSAGEMPPLPKGSYSIPLAGILVEGARMIDRVSFYSSKWLLQVPVPLKEIPQLIAEYFTPDECTFFSRLLEQSPRSCQELIARLNMQPIDFWRKILAFYLLDMLEFQASTTRTDMTKDIADLLELNQKIEASPGASFSLLGLSPDDSAVAIENARAQYLARFSPERFGSAAAPEIKKIAHDVHRRILDIVPPPAVRPSSDVEPPPRTLSFPDTRSPQEAQAGASDKSWNFYLKGKELFEQGQFVQAIQVLKQAIKLEPTHGDFYYFLGQSQKEFELLKPEAEINLKKAIELSPWNAEPVYALGVFYRSENKMKMAERCFQRVKEISHSHSGASQALADLRRLRQSKKGKGFFRKKKTS